MARPCRKARSPAAAIPAGNDTYGDARATKGRRMKFSPINPRDAKLLGSKRVGKILEGLRAGELPTDDEVIEAIKAVPIHFLLEPVILGYEPQTKMNGTLFGVTG